MWTFFRETNNHRFKTTYILRNPFTGWKINGTPQNSCYCCWYLELVQPENELFGHDFHWTIDRRKSQKMSGNQKTCKILFLPTSQFWGGQSKIAPRPKTLSFRKICVFYTDFFCKPEKNFIRELCVNIAFDLLSYLITVDSQGFF